jgi:invasion protein IalB
LGAIGRPVPGQTALILGPDNVRKRKKTIQHGARYSTLAFTAALLIACVTDRTHADQASSTGAKTPRAPEVSPRGQGKTREIKYGDWRKLCFKSAGTKTVCRTTISGTWETGQTAFRIDVIERDGDSTARLQMFLPVGLYLQAGVKLTIDQGITYRFPYVWCLTNACVAADLADPNMIREMETGQTLLLEVVDTNVLAITTSLPLNQFAAVHQGAPSQTFDQAIDE